MVAWWCGHLQCPHTRMSNSNNLTELFKSSQAYARRTPQRRTVRPLSQAFILSQSSQSPKLSATTSRAKPEPQTPERPHQATSALSALEYGNNTWIKSDTTTSDMDEEMAMDEVPTSEESYGISEKFSDLAVDTFQPHVPRPSTWQFKGEPTIVAYSPKHQAEFDRVGLAWGVQWEIARMVTTHPELSWDDVRLDLLEQLCGSCSENAPQVASVLFDRHPHFEAIRLKERVEQAPVYSSPWEEYDLEEDSLRSGSTARLGCESEYFGGKVDQVLRLTVDTHGKFIFRLQPPSKSKSFRFRRFLGSRRLLDVRFSESEPRLRPEKLRDFFTQTPLVINGRIFRAFYARRNGVHLVETNEDLYRPGDPLVGDQFRMSLREFIEWHNPLYANPGQSLTKWASRFALGFSDSQPGLCFAPHNIVFIDDIVPPGQTSNSAIMTDGAGYMNYAALYQLTGRMKWTSVPVTVQARFAGAKGLFILHPSDRSLEDEPRIYIRPSQVKVKLHFDSSQWCASHRILDVLARGVLSTGVQVTDQVIVNLSHNCVDTATIDTLTRSHIENASFIPLMRNDRMPQLWEMIYNHKRVQDMRLKGLTPAALARAQGLVDLSDENETRYLSGARFTYRPDPHSGSPPNYDTQALSLLQSGFDWRFFPLFSRLESIQKQILFGLDEKCHLHIPNSAFAYIIPDPLGVLDEGEIFCGFQTPVFDHILQRTITCVTGPVLVTRNPCILPSDMRKVVAVNSPELWTAGYQDVIVFSVKGKRSLASMLGGGDYDGDKVTLIWEDSIVSPFTNSPTHYPDLDVSDHFAATRSKMQDVDPEDYEPVLNALLALLVPNQVGMYGNWHMTAAKLLGLDHPETVRLGNVFATCLDSVKTGLTIHRHLVSRDSAKWNDPDRSRAPVLTVIEDLKSRMDQYRKECEDEMAALRPYSQYDNDLLKPYRRERELCDRVPGLKEELDQIVAFVDRMRDAFYEGEYTVHKRHGQPRFARPQGGRMHSTGEQQERKWAASEAYNQGLPRGFLHIRDEAVRRIAASYAYSKDSKWSPDFSFAVAWSELCKIKAEAKGSTVVMESRFGDIMSISKRMRDQLDLIYDTEQ